MRQRLTTLAEVVGMCAIAFGLGMVAVPLGVIGAGVVLVVVGYLEGP
jgi:hypothetical protein